MKTYSQNQLERYPIYLKYFKELLNSGEEFVTSPVIAAKLGYSEEQVRKDLQAISSESGRPKRGRPLGQLINDLEEFLGYKSARNAVLIGVGHLGGALLNFPAFLDMGLDIVAGFDVNPAIVGSTVGGKTIYSLSDLSEVMTTQNAHVAILTVPYDKAQEIADLAIDGGAKAIWNFAPAYLEVPDGIVLENVNLASSLAVLSHRLDQIESKEH